MTVVTVRRSRMFQGWTCGCGERFWWGRTMTFSQEAEDHQSECPVLDWENRNDKYEWGLLCVLPGEEPDGPGSGRRNHEFALAS